jgi:hypothetical protein
MTRTNLARCHPAPLRPQPVAWSVTHGKKSCYAYSGDRTRLKKIEGIAPQPPTSGPPPRPCSQ